MKADINILVLYSHLSGYWMACMKAFAAEYEVTFTVIQKKVSGNAPFDFSETPDISLYTEETFSDGQLFDFALKQKPNLVYVAGWNNSRYRKIAKHFYKTGIPVICGMDNQWKNTLKQHVGKYIFKYYLSHIFTHVWIPGLYQFEFAHKFGLPKNKILTGLYSADVELFSNAYKKNTKSLYPKSFLFVGRLIASKGLMELAVAFQKIKNDTGSNWSLTIVGNGPLKEQLKNFSCIRIIDFVQPQNLPELMAEHGVFILPSITEPWGVVIHEAAACGRPIITTCQCGAGTAFVRNGYNGYLTEAGNSDDLFKAMKKITRKSDSVLYKMGERSSQLSYQFTPHSWASTLYTLIESQ